MNTAINKAKVAVIGKPKFASDWLSDTLKAELNIVPIASSQSDVELIKLIASEKPKIILLDICAEGCQFFELIDAIKGNPVLSNIPMLILISESHTLKDVEQALKRGVFDFIYHTAPEYMLLSKINYALKLSYADEFVKKSSTRNAQLMNTIKSIIIGVDTNGRITSWNNEAVKFFGLERAKTIGATLHKLKLNWNWEAVAEEIANCLTRDVNSNRFELSYFSDTKGNRVLSVVIMPLTDEESEEGGYLILADDITEQKIKNSQENQLHRLQSIGQLAAGIAHEINTPMQYVSDNTHYLKDVFADLDGFIKQTKTIIEDNNGSADLLKNNFTKLYEESDYQFLSEDIPNAIEQSLEGIRRVVTIVKAMKDFSHPGSDKKEPLDINRAVESTVSVTRNEWKYVADMETDLDPDAGDVMCYGGHLNEVILNIIINAAHAIGAANLPDKGKITIATRRTAEFVEVTIKDTGSGIPEEAQAKIFEPFFTTKEVGKGTGQGLAICHSIVVEQHGGELFFETAKDMGTTFFIRLPA